MKSGKQSHGRLLHALLIGMIAVGVLIPAATVSENVPPPSPTAERLVIRYEQGSFEIISRTPLAKVLPASVALPDSVGRVRGNWFEVQSPEGKTVYRRLISAPDIVYTEYRSPDNPARLKREQATVAERTISVLVPASDDAAYLVFYGSPRDVKMRGLAATEIGRVRLR